MDDERGISEEVFKLAMIVIVVAAILAILASILSNVRYGGESASNATATATKCMADEMLCEQKGCGWTPKNCSCSC